MLSLPRREDSIMQRPADTAIADSSHLPASKPPAHPGSGECRLPALEGAEAEADAALAEREWQRLVLFVVALAFLLVLAGAVNAQSAMPTDDELPATRRPPADEGSPLRTTAASNAGGAGVGTRIAPARAAGAAQGAGAQGHRRGVLAHRTLDASGSGRMLLTDGDGNRLLAPWLDTDVDVTVSGVIARVTVRQGFLNVSDRWVAGDYTFPLPGDAAVQAMRLDVAGRQIVGEIQPRVEARETYERAKADGKLAGLVEQQRDDVFAVGVANIPPGERVDVVMEYVQPVAFDADGFAFRFPMTITPRYQPATLSAPGRAAEALEGPRPALVHALLDESQDYRALASVRLRVDGSVDPASLVSHSHPVEHSIDSFGAEVRLRDRKVPMDHDFVLRWQPAGGAVPDVAVFTESLDGETYALAVVVPPTVLPETPLPREMILVIDVSGSMQGQSIRQARRAATFALDALTPADRINVIAFNGTTRTLFPFAVPADHHAVRRARDFLRGLKADGGTEMYPALAQAFSPRPPADHLRQVVFVTDGAVGGEADLIALIRRERGEARLFPVGIGAAPASHLMQRMADAGQGSYTQIGTVDEVGERMAELFTKLEHPVLTGIEVRWPGVAEPWPQAVPDLYAGEPLMLTARVPDADGVLRLSGWLGRRPWSQQVALNDRVPAPGVGILWARRKVAALTSGAGTPLSAEQVRDEVTEIGLRHSLTTRYTSFVAVERQPIRPLMASLEDTLVPTLAPAGGRRVGYPSTATPAPAQLSLACVALLFGALLWTLGGSDRPRRREPSAAPTSA
jgi:Ca-activated chloride channel family protein